ncbi:DUF3592 domain-containing protein [Microlunatus sp. GCM10028923]|uniref:DUF3592 domain-containing protein n=1 Tax=Microlunatus sp. GCM10028923 TaxID=3273400 RepID=UPI00361D741D
MDSRLIAVLIFVAAALIMIAILGSSVWQTVRLIRTGHRLTGQCTEVYQEVRPGRRFAPLWFATVRYTMPDGRRYALDARTRTRTVGELIMVRARTEHPEGARIDEWWQLWWRSLMIGSFTVVFVLAAWMVITGWLAATA